MTSAYIINYISDELSKKLNVQPQNHGERQTNSKYFYINRENKQLMILRLSDHHPKFQKYISKDNNYPYPSSENNSNISIEFFSKQKVVNGKRIKNKMNPKVSVAKCTTKPNENFIISSYSYKASKLDKTDIDQIIEAILAWVNSMPQADYNDPLEADKKAKSCSEKSILRDKNDNGEYVKLTEAQLKVIIRKMVKKAIHDIIM